MPEVEDCKKCNTECHARFIGTSKFLFEDSNCVNYHTQKRCLEQQKKSALEERFANLESDVRQIKEKMGIK